MTRVLIVAGDPSGDIVGSQLIKSMKRMKPDLVVSGLGGKQIEAVSDRFLGNIVEQHALGFAITPKTILYFRNVLNNILVPELEKNPPDVVIPVDFYGFNSCVARLAKDRGFRVFYYVSPQFWASRPWRADRLRKVVDLFLCLFPFEVDFYRRRNLPAQFVGHPILDTVPFVSRDNPPARVEANIGLLPGSRPEEIKRHLPVMTEACKTIQEKFPGTRFFLFTVPHVPKDLYHRIIRKAGKSSLLIELIQDENYLWRSQLDMAMTASGMETLENTILGIPMVVMYKTNWVTYAVARLLIRIPFIAMPNLLSDKMIVPEFIQWEATASRVVAPVLQWLEKPALRRELRIELLNLREKLGEKGASDRAARTILEKVA